MILFLDLSKQRLDQESIQCINDIYGIFGHTILTFYILLHYRDGFFDFRYVSGFRETEDFQLDKIQEIKITSLLRGYPTV